MNRVEISRRQILAGLTAASAALAARLTRLLAQSRGQTFVLVHGAWHGGWCWKKVTPLLISAARQVHAPTLTGLGERSHLLTPDINLKTHIDDVTSLFHYEDIHDVVLVGHSYGGMVVAGAAPAVASRLARVIYLDAFLPDDGKALQDYVQLSASGDAWRLPPPGKPPRFGVRDPDDVAWMEARLTDQPRKTMTEPVRVSADISGRVPHTYILCSKSSHFVAAAERAKQRGFRYRELLSAGHDAMISQPAELAKLLLED
jgi:pimeloyl-ACP methyl ester carboxylesterase